MTKNSIRKLGRQSLLITLFLFICSQAFAMSDEACMECHSDPDMTTEKNGVEISLLVDHEIYKDTIHAENGCISCHEDADVEEGEDHPMPLAPVSCENCHDDVSEMYAGSMHGQSLIANDPTAPACYDCHTKHYIFPRTDRRATTYPLNIPATCGSCHQEDSEMTQTHVMTESNIVKNYSMSIHGAGLYDDGLIVTATCSSCHPAHTVQNASHPDSSVNRNNITGTCSTCHVGVVDQFNMSVHSPLVTKTDKKLPVCTDCHTTHTISNVRDKDFRLIIADQCSNCHEHETKTFLESYHGRAGLLLGGEKAAKCSDCHGSHNIMPVESPESMINTANIVETCRPCHAKSNESFTTYLAHGTYNDKEKYPALFYTFWAMTGLLVSTFSIFGLHTILWVPRSLIERFKEIGKG